MPDYAPLNWKEVALRAPELHRRVEGLFVEKIFVPERAGYPSGFIKGEWALRLTGRTKGETTLVFSVRPRMPYVAIIESGGAKSDKGPRAAPGATHAVFSLALVKYLRGSRVLGIEALPRERALKIRFAAPQGSGLALYVNLIPATPEAVLTPDEPGAGELPVLARSRVGQADTFKLPDGVKAPDHLEVRPELVAQFDRAVADALATEAFERRLLALERELKDTIKLARERIRHNETQLASGLAEADWRRYGDLLKGAMGMPGAYDASGPNSKDAHSHASRTVRDFETDTDVTVPCDPKLSLREQVEKHYSLARRKQRRIEEARARLATLAERLAEAEATLAGLPPAGDGAALEGAEQRLGIAPAAAPATGGKPAHKGPRWLGKSFVSRDGLAILVGRSKDENLELTFKHARGNDVWMHVRGRPGAHVVVPVQPGKSPPLETLLDAAALTVYYSGGEKWGKTEVDYAYKKHVKRIRDSTEASYTHNKTLIVEPDGARIRRLLDQQAKP